MPTTPPTLTPAPPAPQRQVKATFSDRVDAFVTWLVAAVAQFAALALNVFNNAKEAYDSAVVAMNWANASSNKAVEAAGSADRANESVLAAAAISSATMWTAGATYDQFVCAVSRVSYKTYRKITSAAANSGGVTDPANDTVNWQAVIAATMPRRQRTSNIALVSFDVGAFIDIVSGTFTQVFDTASFSAGWHCFIRNSGDGDVTIPNSDGRTNWVMYPGEVRLFQWDGVALRSFVITPFYKVFTSSDTWKKPPGYVAFEEMLWGAGASGAAFFSGGGYAVATGGGGGGFSFGRILAVLLPDSVPVTIGAGGPAVKSATAGAPKAGIAGGATSFGSFLQANGGLGGTTSAGTDNASGGAGGSATPGIGLGGTLENGSSGGNGNLASAVGSAATRYSSSGGATASTGNGGHIPSVSGLSAYGGRGGNSNQSTGANDAQPGAIPGGGGGGCATTGIPADGREGARGELRIWGIV